MEREKFASRLGFILISAGCAIGLGNVWRFPFITGKYGGAAFVLVYLVFLVILGLLPWLLRIAAAVLLIRGLLDHPFRWENLIPAAVAFGLSVLLH